MAKGKIKVYELDFGDTNFLSRDIKGILDWIETDISDLAVDGELNYTITIKMMTERQYKNIPDWA